MPRASNSDPRLAAVTWLLLAIVVLGALTLMEAWQLWRLRGDAEAIDPLLVMGLLAALGGLFVGGLAASILIDALNPDEPD